MIIKRVTANERSEQGLKDLVKYISTNNCPNRIKEVGYQNIQLERPEMVATQMVAAARGIGFIEPPFPYKHYVIAWRKDQEEKITNTRELVDDFCELMKFQNVQYFFVKHGDTEHPHIHLVVNRIDTERQKLIVCNKDLGFEIRRLQATRKILEKKYDLFSYMDKNQRKERKYAKDYDIKIPQKEMLERLKERREKERRNAVIELINVLHECDSLDIVEKRVNSLGWKYYFEKKSKEVLLLNKKKDIFLNEKDLPEFLHLDKISARRKRINSYKLDKGVKEKEDHLYY